MSIAQLEHYPLSVAKVIVTPEQLELIENRMIVMPVIKTVSIKTNAPTFSQTKAVLPIKGQMYFYSIASLKTFTQKSVEERLIQAFTGPTSKCSPMVVENYKDSSREEVIRLKKIIANLECESSDE